MNIKVRVFASLKDYFAPELTLDVPPDSQAQAVLLGLEEMNPVCRDLLRSCRLAVNEDFITGEHPLRENEEVAVLPPSSGG